MDPEIMYNLGLLQIIFQTLLWIFVYHTGIFVMVI